MAYKPGTILLVNFGKYGRDENGKLKEHLTSIAQIPFIDYEGFSYLDGYLSKPEKTDRIVIEPGDVEYIRAVAGVLGEFPVRVKCEGTHGSCRKKETAAYLVLPYDRTYNRPERIKNGAPERINQTHFEQSYFCCEYCAGIREEEKRSGREIEESGILKLDISFRLPDNLTKFPEKRKWNVHREKLHGKFRKIAYRLTQQGIDDVIDPAEAMGKKAVITRYAAQEIANKMLRIPENQLPRENEEYDIRKLRWHLSDADRKGQLHLHLGRPY
jgi:hypothetical protein